MAVIKEAAQNFDEERFHLRKLHELKKKKKYQIMNTNRFAPLENLSDDEDINMAWENIKENLKTLAKESQGVQELKQQKPWFDEECLVFRPKEAG
jgi:benzoyl-CoA reductase/2-hydroxyglutaryl-CoA dehydratase subunit BcrC/BadD/HgdB